MTADEARRFANPNFVAAVGAALFVFMAFSDQLGADIPHKAWFMAAALGGVIGEIAAPLIKKIIT